MTNGRPVKLGWITLPSFYADMDRHQKSTTKDVLALLKRLKKENIAGLVVDLAAQRRRLARGSDLAYRVVFEIGADRANQRLEWKHRRLERSGSRDCLRRSAGGADQPAKRFGQ